jgi:flavin reductase (DIM6/NTAB) family NADH-FMN oxidoreductase RutF
VAELKKIVKNYRVVFPTPAALVTSADEQGKPNIATAGEVYMLSLNPLIVAVGFRPATYTNKLISTTREFVVNLPRWEILEQVDFCGCVSGKLVDKFTETGLTPLPAKYVKPPLVKECPVNIECGVLDVIHYPYMDRDVFAGETLAIHIDEEFMSEDGFADLTRFKAIAFASESYFQLTGKPRRSHFSVGKK